MKPYKFSVHTINPSFHGAQEPRRLLVLASEHRTQVLVGGLTVAKHAQHIYPLRGGRGVEVARPVVVLPRPHTRSRRSASTYID